jgi:hypothetical protein
VDAVRNVLVGQVDGVCDRDRRPEDLINRPQGTFPPNECREQVSHQDIGLDTASASVLCFEQGRPRWGQGWSPTAGNPGDGILKFPAALSHTLANLVSTPPFWHDVHRTAPGYLDTRET